MTSPGEPDDWEDGEAVKARLRQQVADAQSRASRAQEMRSEIDAVRGRGTSPRREVVATADASGALMDLKLTDEALEFSPTTLAEMILDATGKARRDAVYKELGSAFGSLSCLSRVTSAVGVGFEIASSLVGMVYALVRDAIADIVAKTLVWVAELALTVGLGTPVVIAQVVTTVSDWVGRTFPSMRRLTDSIVAFQAKARRIQDALERVTNVLGDRTKGPNAVPIGANPIRRGANWVAGEAMSQDTVLEHLFTTQPGNNFKDFENILRAVDTSSLNLGTGIMGTLTPKADIGTLRSVIAMLYEDGQSGAARQLKSFL